MKSLFLSCIILISSTVSAATVTDDIKQTIHLNYPAKRIISLAPDITENLFAINANQQIVGVISGCDYPAPAKMMTSVGTYSGIDIEKIISLKPDLIITWSHTFSRQLNALKQFGIPVYTTEPHQLEDVARTLKNIAVLAGKDKEGESAAKRYLQRLAELRHQYQTTQTTSVFYQIGSYSLITINHDSWINQAISLCGGANVFADLPRIAPEVSWEAVVMANPEVIITDATNKDWQDRWQKWPQMAAVKHKRLYQIHPDLLSRASPRLLEGVSQMCRDIQNIKS